MTQLLIFGLGYTASRIAGAMRDRGWQVDATGSAGNLDFNDRDSVSEALEQATHVLSSVPPDRESGLDPVLDTYRESMGGAWYGYSQIIRGIMNERIASRLRHPDTDEKIKVQLKHLEKYIPVEEQMGVNPEEI